MNRHTGMIAAVALLVASAGCSRGSSEAPGDRRDSLTPGDTGSPADSGIGAIPPDGVPVDSFFIQQTPGTGGDTIDRGDSTSDTAIYRRLE